MRNDHDPRFIRAWPPAVSIAGCFLALVYGSGFQGTGTAPENGAAPSTPAPRTVAVTFDDLPVVSVTSLDATGRRDLTVRLLGSLEREGVPAVGFVNEYGLHGFARAPGPAPDPEGVALLRMWLASGHELANHGFAHVDLHSVRAEAFLEDIERGDAVTGPLMREHGQRLRYFRHPYLHAGRDLATRGLVERFLEERGCLVAPVTVDNEDYLFAAAYSRAAARGDRDFMDLVAREYLAFTRRSFEYSERLAEELFGRPVPHVLLLHANALNADHFDALARQMRERGYRFVPLDQALRDPAYRSPDLYVGAESINWLGRWAISRGLRSGENVLDDFPDVPEIVAAAAD